MAHSFKTSIDGSCPICGSKEHVAQTGPDDAYCSECKKFFFYTAEPNVDRCRCCGGNLANSKPHETLTGVYYCPHCGGLHGQCYKGDKSKIYLSEWHKGPENPDNQRFFDLAILGSEGIEYVHGWFDKTSRKLTQVG